MSKLKPQRNEKINPLSMLKNHKSLVDKVQEELESKGVDFFSPENSLNIDTDFLHLPRNITEVTTKELGEHFNAYTQQKMYMRTLVGWTECLYEDAKREYITASEAKYRELSQTKLSETAKEREVNADPDIKPLYLNFMDYKKKLQLLDLNVLSISDALFMISREISRRTGDWNNETRNENIQRK